MTPGKVSESATDTCPFCSAKGTTGFSRHAKAFPDGYPVADGHTLIVPTKHVASIFDLPPEAQRDLWELVGEVRA